MTRRYWIGVASREHVLLGATGGFSQLCHGKAGPLRRMAGGDWMIYYSPKEKMGGDKPCRRFTAIGRVAESAPYLYDMGGGFVPWRRDVAFLPCVEAEIVPLLDRLSFIADKKHWGYPFRWGHFQVPETDFRAIAAAMLGEGGEGAIFDDGGMEP